jgi:hypothetical protein
MTDEHLSTQLKQQIEDWSSQLLNTSPLLSLARRGELSPAALASYLGSLRHLFESSERNLRRAAVRARELGQAELATHLARKASEEQGHSRWAQDDLSSLPERARAHGAPAAELLRLVALQERLIERHPICFVAYALWAEYFTVLVGEEWLTALAQSGFARGQLSAVARHLDADREHAATGLAVIDALWTGDPPVREITAGVCEACHTFERFCQEICENSAHLM